LIKKMKEVMGHPGKGLHELQVYCRIEAVFTAESLRQFYWIS
jgi:hypothetical protein